MIEPGDFVRLVEIPYRTEPASFREQFRIGMVFEVVKATYDHVHVRPLGAKITGSMVRAGGVISLTTKRVEKI